MPERRPALLRGASPNVKSQVMELFPRPRTEIAPGAVHVPGWLSPQWQQRLVSACREWARPPAGLRAARLPNGARMSVQTVCLGWHWYPYRYSKTVDDGDGAPVKPLPGWLAELGRQAAAEVGPAPYDPDIALVNFYDAGARMGMHQDRDELSRAPVISLSLGDECVFRFGNTENRKQPYTDVELGSGDLFVFGGPSRMAYHGVPKTLPGTADPAIGMSSGRLNITLRESGMD